MDWSYGNEVNIGIPEWRMVNGFILWTWSYGNEVNIGIPEWRMVNGLILWTGAMATQLMWLEWWMVVDGLCGL